jgi:dGTPase
MVSDLVAESLGKDEIGLSDAVFEAMASTRSFLFEKVYLGRIAESTRVTVENVLRVLLEHHAALSAADLGAEADPKVAAVDYVAGMTDRFALRAFEGLVERPAPGLGAEGP